jgi:hypothetical protein
MDLITDIRLLVLRSTPHCCVRRAAAEVPELYSRRFPSQPLGKKRGRESLCFFSSLDKDAGCIVQMRITPSATFDAGCGY